MESSETLPTSSQQSDQLDHFPEEKTGDPCTNQLDTFTDDDDDFGDFEDGGDFQAAEPLPFTAPLPTSPSNTDTTSSDDLLNLSFQGFHLSAAQILSNIQLSPLPSSSESLIPLHQLVAQSQPPPPPTSSKYSNGRRLSWHGSHAEARFLEFLGLKKQEGGLTAKVMNNNEKMGAAVPVILPPSVTRMAAPTVVEPVHKEEENIEIEAEAITTVVPPVSNDFIDTDDKVPSFEERPSLVEKDDESEKADVEFANFVAQTEEEAFNDFVAEEQVQQELKVEDEFADFVLQEEEEEKFAADLPKEIRVPLPLQEEQEDSATVDNNNNDIMPEGPIVQQQGDALLENNDDFDDFVGLPPRVLEENVVEEEDVWQSSAAALGATNEVVEEEEERWHSIQDMNDSIADDNGDGDKEEEVVVAIEENAAVVEEEEEKMEEPQQQQEEEEEEEEEFDDFATVDPVEAVVSQLQDLSFMLHDKIQGPQ